MERFRVTGTYEATITLDVMAENRAEAKDKATGLFECSDVERFSIGNLLDIEADVLFMNDDEPRPQVPENERDEEGPQLYVAEG